MPIGTSLLLHLSGHYPLMGFKEGVVGSQAMHVCLTFSPTGSLDRVLLCPGHPLTCCLPLWLKLAVLGSVTCRDYSPHR